MLPTHLCEISVLLMALILLVGCHEDSSGSKSSKSAEATRIEKEVAARVIKEVEVIEKNLKAKQTLLHTFRILGFIALTGGAAGGLIWLQRNRRYNPMQNQERNLQMPRWRDHYTVRTNRVLELPPPAPPAPQSARTKANAIPQRRRASRKRNRSKDPNHNETPRYR